MFAALVEDLVREHLAVDHRLIQLASLNLFEKDVRRLTTELVLLQSDVVEDVFLLLSKTSELFNLCENFVFRSHYAKTLRSMLWRNRH